MTDLPSPSTFSDQTGALGPNGSGNAAAVRLTQPGRWWVWLPRVLIVFVLGSVAWSVTSLAQTALAARDAGSAFTGPVVVVALTVLFAVPGAVLAWQSTSRPYADAATMRTLSRSLDEAERRAVDRALRRGRGIDPAHRAYAIAKTAGTRRMVIFAGLQPALQWGQAANAADTDFGSGYFSTVAVAAVLSVLMTGFVVFQLRCERSLRAGEPGDFRV